MLSSVLVLASEGNPTTTRDYAEIDTFTEQWLDAYVIQRTRNL